jgi:hypothetical protein
LAEQYDRELRTLQGQFETLDREFRRYQIATIAWAVSERDPDAWLN